MGIASRNTLRAWLTAPGSLSKRLARTGKTFEVEVLRQQVAPLRAQERRALGMPRHGCTVVREVILRVDGEPLVWARSSLHGSALAGPWKALKGLGTRPLAHLLYEDRQVVRSELRPRYIARHGHTGRHMRKQWQAATGSPASHAMVWSRNSVFTRHGACLRIMELFAPGLIRRKP